MKETIFVLPFAGGSSRSFSSWKAITNYQFVYIDMPGKGIREEEPLLHHFPEMVEEGFTQIVKYMKSQKLTNYYIWGHSMGSYLAYQIVKKIAKENMLKPKYLIMSGSVPPQFAEYERIEEIIDNEQLFFDYIVDFGLVTKRIVESRFFKKRYFPQIKSDYKAMLEYRENGDVMCGQKVVFLNGDQDDFLQGNVEKWTDYFEYTPRYMWFSGGHFFIFECVEKMFDELSIVLEESEKE